MRLGMTCRGPREDASGTAATEQGVDDPPPAPGLTRRPSQQAHQVTCCCCLQYIPHVQCFQQAHQVIAAAAYTALSMS